MRRLVRLLIVVTIGVQCTLTLLWSWWFAGKHRTASTASVRAIPPQRSAAVLFSRIRVDQVVLHKLRPSPCATIDWWPSSKCDGGDCSWINSSLLTLDLTDPLLQTALQALAPITLRMGGSLADLVTYAGVGGTGPRDCRGLEFVQDDTRRIGFRGGCLPFERWLALLDFCDRVGCHAFFSVNALRGRKRAECAPGTSCRRLKTGTRPPCCTSERFLATAFCCQRLTPSARPCVL